MLKGSTEVRSFSLEVEVRCGKFEHKVASVDTAIKSVPRARQCNNVHTPTKFRNILISVLGMAVKSLFFLGVIETSFLLVSHDTAHARELTDDRLGSMNNAG
jgi:hypothetical protein